MTRLSESEIKSHLARLPGWDLTPAGIRKMVACKDFKAAVALVNAVADLAEAANHHPDILIFGWNKVTFTLMTHSEKAITERDFALAGHIDSAVRRVTGTR